MSEKNHNIIRIVLGAMLGFQGAKLVGMVLEDRPENYLLLVAVGIAFIVIGVVFTISCVKKHIQIMKSEEVEVISYEERNKRDVEETNVDKKGEDESCE